jgi:FKBP-type peptidyl-prolyl cis-trans isomerase
MGSGPKPQATDEVELHYEGKLENGKIFDSSYARGEKISFPLNQVIAG